ncbi:TonB-dependent receptor [Seonamhaeicola sp.]|uniref:SusC/RagA family TonB-linked outer membrane protein n=1 Tax=Seonamhaeicola sp. TaxID=1912245 RepID=UPI002634C99B|nr:TonB-dependent receptor [Seonamhaeicola sp.]
MRTLIFLLCTAVFSFTSENMLSQNVKIEILEDKTITVDQVFDIIKAQTDYRFIYRSDMFKDFPKVSVKKGIIKVNKLLEESLSRGSFNFNFANNNTIIIKEKVLQEVTISGVVLDKNGVPIPGITVYVTNREPSGERINSDFLVRGTASDFDGKFSLVAEVGYYLVASGIGYEFHTEQVTAEKTVYNITLLERISALEEVVIVGYGSTVRKDLTGSVGSVKSEEIQQIKSQTIDQALVGQLTGVYVNAQSSGPGGGALVNVRGLSQLIGDNQPLYVVDGVPIVTNPLFSNVGSIGAFGDRENPLLSINPNDIERVDVLKDASSAAIYGSRAANGVIVITTKRGKRNSRTRFNFAYNTTIQNPLNTYDVISASEWQQVITDFGLDNLITFGDEDTDWQEKGLNNNALWNQYDFSVSGGSDKINFLVSARVSDQEGIMIGNKFKQYSFTSNIDADLSKRLKAGANISYNYSLNRRSGLTSLNPLAMYRPDIGVFNEDGSYTGRTSFLGFERNPLGDQAKIKNRARYQGLIGSVYGQYEILEGLNFRSQLSINLSNDRSSDFSPSFTGNALFGAFRGTQGALLDVQHSTLRSSSWANTLNFNKTIAEDHTINAVVGVSWDHSRLDLESQGYAGFPDDEVLINIQSAQDAYQWNSDVSETALNSIFGRVNYNYKDRYLVTFTARSDGSIKFGPDNQRGFFPSGALAWNVHNEDFLSNNNLISQLKLRASLGRTGSDNLPAFSYISNYASLGNGDSFYDGINGIAVEGVPNTEIRWEETDQLDLGVEFGLFNGRLNGEVVYFEKKTSDIILLVPLPAQTGSSFWNANIADVTNKGWEIALGGDIVRSKDLRWNSSFNISFVDNNVDALNGGSTTAFGSAGIQEGSPIGFHLGYEVVGIAQTQEEIDALNAGAPDGNYFNQLQQPGDYIFRDLNGDGEINPADDRKDLGSINPEFFGGWNNIISCKNFDFTFNFNFVDGNKRYWREGAENMQFVNVNKNYFRSSLDDTWTPDNPNATYARLGSGTHGGNFDENSKVVVDGSYIKLRSASIAYNIPKEILKKTGINNAKITVTGNNLFVITDYPGLDPENVGPQRGGATVDLVSDQGFSYPQARTFTIGVNIGL